MVGCWIHPKYTSTPLVTTLGPILGDSIQVPGLSCFAHILANEKEQSGVVMALECPRRCHASEEQNISSHD